MYRTKTQAHTHTLTVAINTIAAEVKSYGSLPATAASYSGVVQRHMQPTEGRLRMMGAYTSASVGDVFMFLLQNKRLILKAMGLTGS
jgi:hypothetical protein